jgi:hypothetical protein
MDDLHERLDRLAGRVTDEGDAYERLGVTRRRRERRRRIGAGALALVVAVGGTFAAFSAIKSGPDTTATPAGYELPAVPYLWPENWARQGGATPEDMQSKVDAGDGTVQWRTDPEKVAVRFAENVIGLPTAFAFQTSYGSDVPGIVFELSPCLKCVLAPRVRQYVWVRQPDSRGPTGIWDVAGAWADTLDVGIGHQLGDRTDTLVADGTLHMDLQYPDDQTVTVGLVAQNGCSQTSRLAQQGTTGPTGSGPYDLGLLDVADSDHPIPSPVIVTLSDAAGCGMSAAGYAFAYTVPQLTVPTGDPFLEVGSIDALTAMPLVLNLQASSSPTPTAETSGPVRQLVIACDDAGARIVGGGEVIAQPDGAHILFQPPSIGTSSLWVPGVGSIGKDGTNEMVIDAPPGQHSASCQTGGRTFGSVTFSIVNPNGDWMPTPAFAGTTCSTANWEGLPQPPEYSDPVEAAREKLGSRLKPGDVLEQVGYPEAAESRTVAAVRDGVTVATVEIARGDSGWFASAITTCE